MPTTDFYRSERNFRRYEPPITAACSAYPNAIRFAPPNSNRSITTDKARLRDAITAWCDGRWETDACVTPDKMRDLTVWIEVFNGIEHILVGPRKVGTARRATYKILSRANEPLSIETIPTALVDSSTPQPLAIPESLSARINALDAGEITERFTYPFTPELHAEITSLIANKLNVQIVLRDNTIILF